MRPQVNINALWPITQLNTLKLDIGLGYAFYLDHSDYNTNGVLLSPGSQLSFDIFVGDFRINFHDRFSLEQDPSRGSRTQQRGRLRPFREHRRRLRPLGFEQGGRDSRLRSL